MVRRSVLFTPGDRPELLEKAPRSDADVLAFDLEDGVAPDRRQEARHYVRDCLRDPAFDPDAEVCVRIQPRVDEARSDLETVIGPDADSTRLDSVMVPKVESVSTLERVQDLLDEVGIAVPVLALLETAGGILEANAIAESGLADALVFGAEDLAADVGLRRTHENTEILYARQRIVLAGGAHDCETIDTVYTDFEDEQGLAREAREAVQFGFDGKLAIHPAQVGLINEAFTPPADEIEWARAVLEKKALADADGRAVFAVDGEMIDAPLIAQAERIVDRATAAGKLSRDDA